MAEPTLDTDPTKVQVQSPKAETRDLNEAAKATAVGRIRPAELKLTRSLSKSDSDLLASPLSEEEGALAGRSESMTNCSSGQQRMERSPSFASEWDEVMLLLWVLETSGRMEWEEGVALSGLMREEPFKIQHLIGTKGECMGV